MADSASTTAFGERLAGFDEHWRAIEPELKRIEAGRWLALAGAGVLLALGALAGFVGAGLIAIFDTDPGSGDADGAGFFLAAVLIGAAFFVARRPSRKAGRLIKEKVVGFLGLTYTHDASGFPIATFEEFDLLPSHSDSNLWDLVEGEVSGVPIQMCDAELTRQEGTGKNRRTVTVFRGPLVISTFPKRMKGRTVVVPDGGAIGNFFGGLTQGSGERVRLESPEFEREFEIYSSDQVEARYLLTPTTMERLLAFKQRFKGKLSLAFAEGNLLLALDDRRDWFPDPGLFQNLTDPRLVHDQAEEIARLAEIVETLKLNAESRI